MMDKKSLSILLGKNIAYWRKQRGLSQEELSEMIDVTKQYLAHVERGERILSVPTLHIVAEVLKVSIDSLLYERDMVDAYSNNIVRMLTGKTDEEKATIEKIICSCIQLSEGHIHSESPPDQLQR